MGARLAVISGPNLGAVYFLKEGANSIGRDNSSDIILDHRQVSKKHCIINISNGRAELVDAGARNGTFINGLLIKKKELESNERISIGPFVLEIIGVVAAGASSHSSSSNNQNVGGDFSEETPNVLKSQTEKSFVKKLFYRFNELVLPVFYDLHSRHTWVFIFSGLFLTYTILHLGMSVYPLLESAKESVTREAERRAFYIARQMAESNQIHIAKGKRERLDVDFAYKDRAVRDAFITDLNGRIQAPALKLNEEVTQAFVVKMLKRMKTGDQKYWSLNRVRSEDGERVLVTVPIMVRSLKRDINVPKALAVLDFSLNRIALDVGTISVIYLETFMISLLLGVVFIYIMSMLTTNMIGRLGDDIDEVLKGNEAVVPRRYKFEVLDSLIESINGVLSRIPDLRPQDSPEEVATTDNEQQIVESFMAPLQFLVTNSLQSMLLLNSNSEVIAVSHSFEDISGIHGDPDNPLPVQNLISDDALMSLFVDMMEKGAAGSMDDVQEDYEFGSGLHRVQCLAIHSLPEKIEAYLFIANPAGGEGEYGS